MAFRKPFDRLRGTRTITIKLPVDSEGFLDRQCASEECRGVFKVAEGSWKDHVKDEVVFCPFCRHQDKAEEWNTEEQNRYVRRKAKELVEREVHGMLKEWAKDFNSTQRSGGLISMSMSVKPQVNSWVFPARFAEAMKQKIACEACGCVFASIGAAYFCPACGHNSVLRTFSETLKTIRGTLAAISALSAAIGDGDKDHAVDVARLLVEQSLVRVVGGFERFSEARFQQVSGGSEFKRGAFQRLGDASDLWEKIGRRRYDQVLSSSDMAFLGKMLQKRHLLAHREGVVDSDYLKKTNDPSIAVGQRIRLKEADVIRVCELLEVLARELGK
ncbi:hypothetical protein SAMN02745166_01182 [Prosthecobacter debontii]|uniref:RiboL-PSP-HEPN domain-containing protein n=1 Tax=Prosthecobacter debontii TaxID=48467 RepID=A0A1T4X8C2_9BACT|nr:hypothetical protein [Prosthecobacter debontii]SKA85677.1 hypothetical protein SAMN02745166_01182 [Prosthecobacter debontii]